MQSQITVQSVTVKQDQTILSQSLSHYLAHIEIFRYSSTEETSLAFTVKVSGFFMYADLNSDSCHVCYYPAGLYKRKVPAGSNQIMVITFKSEWLIYKCKKLTELAPFTGLLYNLEDRPVNLPCARMAKALFRSLQKLNNVDKDLDMDNDGYIFINGCINKYYQKLKRNTHISHYHQHKATEISTFINEHFTTEDAENLAKLAARFLVSQRSLARLAKIAFGKPLHEHVILLRMRFALDLLLTTDKPIFEIAILSGYKEAYYFSKAFKKQFGVCPKLVERPFKIAAKFAMQA